MPVRLCNYWKAFCWRSPDLTLGTGPSLRHVARWSLGIESVPMKNEKYSKSCGKWYPSKTVHRYSAASLCCRLSPSRFKYTSLMSSNFLNSLALFVSHFNEFRNSIGESRTRQRGKVWYKYLSFCISKAHKFYFKFYCLWTKYKVLVLLLIWFWYHSTSAQFNFCSYTLNQVMTENLEEKYFLRKMKMFLIPSGLKLDKSFQTDEIRQAWLWGVMSHVLVQYGDSSVSWAWCLVRVNIID